MSIKGTGLHPDEIEGKLLGEIKSLQSQLKKCKDMAFNMAVEKNHQLSKVTAGRDRYREALERVEFDLSRTALGVPKFIKEALKEKND